MRTKNFKNAPVEYTFWNVWPFELFNGKQSIPQPLLTRSPGQTRFMYRAKKSGHCGTQCICEVDTSMLRSPGFPVDVWLYDRPSRGGLDPSQSKEISLPVLNGHSLLQQYLVHLRKDDRILQGDAYFFDTKKDNPRVLQLQIHPHRQLDKKILLISWIELSRDS